MKEFYWGILSVSIPAEKWESEIDKYCQADTIKDLANPEGNFRAGMAKSFPIWGISYQALALFITNIWKGRGHDLEKALFTCWQSWQSWGEKAEVEEQCKLSWKLKAINTPTAVRKWMLPSWKDRIPLGIIPKLAPELCPQLINHFYRLTISGRYGMW